MSYISNVNLEQADKEIFELYEIQTDRINFKGSTNDLKNLNEFQEKALSEIKTSFEEKERKAYLDRFNTEEVA